MEVREYGGNLTVWLNADYYTKEDLLRFLAAFDYIKERMNDGLKELN